MPKHLAMLHARENNIRIIMLSEPMVLRNVIAFASFFQKYRSNSGVIMIHQFTYCVNG